jgi:hypothetical protein
METIAEVVLVHKVYMQYVQRECSYVPRSCGLLLTRGANDKQGATMAKASTTVVARIVGAV